MSSVKYVLDAIERAALKSPDKAVSSGTKAVKLVAVSKGQRLEDMRRLYDLGLRVFGESKTREALPKIEAMPCDAEFHFIGRLQTNKANRAAEHFALIHSVDSLKLAESIDRRAAGLGRANDILVQVNLSGEPQKGGVPEGELAEFLEKVKALPHISVKGLMMVPKWYEDAEINRPLFAKMYRIYKDLGLSVLSMGMSGDFQTAIEEGANMVRIGTMLFGERTARAAAENVL